MKFLKTSMKKEQFSSYSHLFGALASLLGLVFLIKLSYPSVDKIIFCLIYTSSTMFLFICSGLYHAFKKTENEISIWRKLDHIAIFVMIAGTYTPVCYLYLDGIWRWGIIGAQWFLVLCGLIFKLIILNVPRFLTIAIYLLQGWMALFPIYQFYLKMTPIFLMLMALGGILYSIGAIIYNRKKPDPIPNVFGFHEIFHVLILLGALSHYFLILLSLAY
jgi:hemolysin III